MSFIKVENVTKQYQVFKRKKGFVNSMKSLFHREYETKIAVDNISFEIESGELVGYIGANGAGKSSTVKMLAGILLPTAGSLIVDGKVPYLDRKENAMKVGVVFGQRSQLYWNLPMEETFELYKKIYKIDDRQFKKNVDFYVSLLDMEQFLRTPVRQLSLGQRMRAELVVSLLHDPKILYLDEPTIGLDVLVKQKIRSFIREVNKEKKITVMLTTHDMDDIEQICDRIITIDKGKIVYDGSVDSFKNNFTIGHVLIVDFYQDNIKLHDPRLHLFKEEGLKKWIMFNKDEIGLAEAIHIVSRDNLIADIRVREPDIEDAVRTLYENNIEGRKTYATSAAK